MSAVEPIEEIEASYDFDDAFQEKIVALSIRDTKFARRTSGLIKPDYMTTSAHGVLLSIAEDYFEKYGTLPGSVATWKEVFKEIKGKKLYRDDLMKAAIGEFPTIMTTDVSDRDFVIDKVAEFAKHQAVQNATLAHVDLVDKGRYEEAQAVMEAAFRIGALSDIEMIDYWNDVDRRTQYRKDVASGKIKPNGISTGFKPLDNLLYHKGWGRKELSVLMGAAKRGKSMGLGEFALRASQLGYNVFYATCEVASDIISDRWDANLSATEMNSLTAKISHVEKVVKDKAAAKGRGHLKISEFASGTLTCSQLSRALERSKADGLKFDLIVVDYADIMAADRPSGNPIEDSKQIWLGLRAIAFEEDAGVLTATQTNRDGFRNSTAKADDVAEDFNKIRIADIVISINRTEDETENNEARLYFAASRNQGGDFTIKIKQDMAKGRFMTSIEGMT